MKPRILLLAMMLLLLPGNGFSEPVRGKGISMQFLPERAAKLEGRLPGFYVDYADYLASEPRQPVLQTPVELVAYVKKQDPEVRENGVWVLLFNPAAYSEEEDRLLEKIKSAAKKSDIPLFFHYASDPTGEWRRQ
ncbi:MAG TPA: hypothetical protein VJ910_03425 [Desulfuromonadales bacterium]|nr:hypothetical protein [Desulfuromonadales bacterium]